MVAGLRIFVNRHILAPLLPFGSETADQMIAFRIGAALVVSAFLSACANSSHRIALAPNAAEPAGASKVDMLVETTRSRSATPGVIFSGDRARERSRYHLVVSVPPDRNRKIGEVQWPRQSPPNPRTDFVTLKAEDMDEAELDKWFSSVAGRKHKLFVFVHGFNSTFPEAAYRLAQIVHDSGMEAAPVLFTWPSRGRVLDYAYDAVSAAYSRDALEYVLTRAATDPNVSDITVMAHSLGNWVMMEALRQMSIRHGRIYPKIKNVIMAAPDLDVDLFRSELQQIGSPRPRTTILVSQDDKALAFSKSIGGNVARVGELNPDLPQYKSKLAQYNIVVINLTKLKSGDPFNHSKFAESPEIIRLIGKRLIAGQEIEGRDLTLGERVTGGRVRKLSQSVTGLIPARTQTATQ
jgi:esterase/lipase superfamily enzyme